MIVHIDADKARKFVNECTFDGPNAEAVRDAMIAALDGAQLHTTRLEAAARDAEELLAHIRPSSAAGQALRRALGGSDG